MNDSDPRVTSSLSHQLGNAATIDAYQDGWEQYIAGTPTVPLDFHGPWLPDALTLAKQNIKDFVILEIGSGPGHDAANLTAAGHRVQCSDAAPAFVAHLQAQGRSVRQLNILTDEPPRAAYGMVYSFAVFQHFTDHQFNIVLRKCRDTLQPGGVLAFSMRRGSGTQWETRKGLKPRLFTYWQPGPLWHTVETAGLRMNALHQNTAVFADSDPLIKTWLLVTAVKA